MRLHKNSVFSILLFALLIGLPAVCYGDVVSLTGYTTTGNNCGAIDLVATVNGSATQVIFQYRDVFSGEEDWNTIFIDENGEDGWGYSWDTGDIYSWEIEVRARVLPDGIWMTSDSFKVFNLTTNSILGINSPASGALTLSTTYTETPAYIFPPNFPVGAPNYTLSSTYRYTSAQLVTTQFGTITNIRTNFQGSGTNTVTFMLWGAGPSTTTAIMSSSSYSIGVGLLSWAVNFQNVPVGCYVGMYTSAYNTGCYVVYRSSSSGGAPMSVYGAIRYGTSASGSWSTSSSYQGPAIEFTLTNPYLDFQGVEFGYKDGVNGTPVILGDGVDDGSGTYTCGWTTNLTNQEIGSDKIYVGTRTYNKDRACGWYWQGPYTVTNDVSVRFMNSLNKGQVQIDEVDYDVTHVTTWTFLDSHTISTPLYMDEENTTRKKFSQWSNGGTRTQTFKFNTTSSRMYYATYLTQYYFSAATPYGEITGATSGWYDANSFIGSSVDEYVVMENGRFACTGWIGTGSIGNGTTNDTGSFRITEATTIAFTWAKQYRLDITTDHGQALGAEAGWQSDGQSLISYVDSPIAITATERWACTGWTGTGSIGDGVYSYTGEFQITEDTSIIWNWERQYLLEISTNYGSVIPGESSWHFVGTEVTVAAYSPGDTTEQRFGWQGWTGVDSGEGTSFIVTMDKARSYTAEWSAEYYLNVVAQNGSIGDEYSGWYNAGSSVDITAIQPDPQPGVRYVLGWGGSGFTEIAAAVDTPNPITIEINSAVSVFSNWESQYSLQIINPQGVGTPNPAIGTYWYFIGAPVEGYTNFRAQGLVCQGFIGTGSASSSSEPFFSFKMTEPSTITWQWAESGSENPAQWSNKRQLGVNLGGSLVDSLRAADGSPVVAYYSEVDNCLKVAMLEDNEWKIDSVFSCNTKVDGATGTTPGNSVSIALDSSGVPHVLFYDSANKRLVLASYADNDWVLTTIDDEGDPGLYCSLKFYKGSVPHFAYYRAETGALVYAVLENNVLTRTVVDEEGNVGLYANLALNPRNGTPRIAYYDASNANLKCAIFDGEEWTIAVVDAEGDVGMECCIDTDAAGEPLIAYQENTSEEDQGLRFAFFYDAAWHVYEIDSTDQTAFGVDMGVDVNGNPHISYHNYKGLNYAFFNGSVWTSMTLLEGDTTGCTSIAFDAEGNPAITFWEGSDLLYIDSKTNPYEGMIEVDEYLQQTEEETGEGGGGGCFVATAAFGSLSSKAVVALTGIRDSEFLASNSSTSLVKLYYCTGVEVASSLRNSESLRALVRFGLMEIVR